MASGRRVAVGPVLSLFVQALEMLNRHVSGLTSFRFVSQLFPVLVTSRSRLGEHSARLAREVGCLER